MTNHLDKAFKHQPVLLQEILRDMAWDRTSTSVIDFTVGGGGHLRALLEANPKVSQVFAVDQDPDALNAAKENLKHFSDIQFIHANFSEAARAFLQKGEKFDRILVDLGVSSFQLDQAHRGFSFQKDGPLDMRMNPLQGEPASDWLMHCSEEEMTQVLRDYGEEPRARYFAKKWMEARILKKATTTKEFVEAFKFSFESKDRNGRHPLTRVFQALRMHINQEFQVLQKLLEYLPDLLNLNGRVSILSFHSLEDREVKWLLRGKLKQIHKKVQIASEEEQRSNPRSRSAKLRVFERQQND